MSAVPTVSPPVPTTMSSPQPVADPLPAASPDPEQGLDDVDKDGWPLTPGYPESEPYMQAAPLLKHHPVPQDNDTSPAAADNWTDLAEDNFFQGWVNDNASLVEMATPALGLSVSTQSTSPDASPQPAQVESVSTSDQGAQPLVQQTVTVDQTSDDPQSHAIGHMPDEEFPHITAVGVSDIENSGTTDSTSQVVVAQAALSQAVTAQTAVHQAIMAQAVIGSPAPDQQSPIDSSTINLHWLLQQLAATAPIQTPTAQSSIAQPLPVAEQFVWQNPVSQPFDPQSSTGWSSTALQSLDSMPSQSIAPTSMPSQSMPPPTMPPPSMAPSSTAQPGEARVSTRTSTVLSADSDAAAAREKPYPSVLQPMDPPAAGTSAQGLGWGMANPAAPAAIQGHHHQIGGPVRQHSPPDSRYTPYPSSSSTGHRWIMRTQGDLDLWYLSFDQGVVLPAIPQPSSHIHGQHHSVFPAGCQASMMAISQAQHHPHGHTTPAGSQIQAWPSQWRT